MRSRKLLRSPSSSGSEVKSESGDSGISCFTCCFVLSTISSSESLMPCFFCKCLLISDLRFVLKEGVNRSAYARNKRRESNLRLGAAAENTSITLPAMLLLLMASARRLVSEALATPCYGALVRFLVGATWRLEYDVSKI